MHRSWPAILLGLLAAPALSAENALSTEFEDPLDDLRHFQEPFFDARLSSEGGTAAVIRTAEEEGGVDWPQVDGLVHISLADLPILEIKPDGPVRAGDQWVGTLVFFRANVSRDYAGEIVFQGVTGRTDWMRVDVREFAARFPDVGYYWLRLRPLSKGQGFRFDHLAAFTRAKGTGLKGEYFDAPDFSGRPLTRVDKTVDFDWGVDQPSPGVGPNAFSARWEGLIEVPSDGEYTFYTLTDDGVRLWVGGRLLINDWNEHAPFENASLVRLHAGKHALKMEYFDDEILAVAKLMWEGPGFGKQIIPQKNLTPPPLAPCRFDPPADVYPRPVRVAVHPPEGTTARYTLDGREPTGRDQLLPDNGRVLVKGSATLRIKAWKEGHEPALFEARYDIRAIDREETMKNARRLLSLNRPYDAVLEFDRVLKVSPADRDAEEGIRQAVRSFPEAFPNQ